ncbi:MAG: hypothetical protein SGPRY_009119, partial [Prymnesium sp.]
LGLMVLQQIIGINTIMYYSGEILKQAHVGSDETVIWLTAPVASGQLVGCLLGMSLIDKHGRRPLVLASLAGVVISLGLEGAVFAVEEWYCHTDMNAVSGDIPLSEQQDGICFIFLALYMPETAQKKLEDIEKIFLPSPRASANYGNTNLDGEPRR